MTISLGQVFSIKFLFDCCYLETKILKSIEMPRPCKKRGKGNPFFRKKRMLKEPYVKRLSRHNGVQFLFSPGTFNFSFFTDYGMDIQLFHNSVNSVLAVAGMIKMIDPGCHSPVSQDMTKPFIILFDKFCESDIFKFLIRHFTM